LVLLKAQRGAPGGAAEIRGSGHFPEWVNYAAAGRFSKDKTQDEN
jgi:hypothetical protein